MTLERQYQATLIHLEQELDGFLGAAFISLRTGQSLVAHSIDPSFDSSTVSAAICATISAQQSLVNSINGAEIFEIIMVTCVHHVHVVQPVTDDLYLYVAADRHQTNIAMLKSIANQSVAAYGDPVRVPGMSSNTAICI